MNTYVALFRGINVGGNNIISMKELKNLFEKLKFQNVKSYIQSGNIIFDSHETDVSKLIGKIAIALQNTFRMNPHIFLLSKKDIEKAIKINPFVKAVDDHKSLHFFFLASKPVDAEISKMEEMKRQTEQFVLTDKVLYLFAPEGIGKSKLAANVERLLGVSATARNWRTINEVYRIMNKQD